MAEFQTAVFHMAVIQMDDYQIHVLSVVLHVVSVMSCTSWFTEMIVPVTSRCTNSKNANIIMFDPFDLNAESQLYIIITVYEQIVTLY